MNLIITKNYEEMSKMAAVRLLSEIVQGAEKRVNLSITGGSTPVGAYDKTTASDCQRRKKAAILKKVLEGPVILAVPASILRLHPNITVIADWASASK